jgi:hypothetical protein
MALGQISSMIYTFDIIRFGVDSSKFEHGDSTKGGKGSCLVYVNNNMADKAIKS